MFIAKALVASTRLCTSNSQAVKELLAIRHRKNLCCPSTQNINVNLTLLCCKPEQSLLYHQTSVDAAHIHILHVLQHVHPTAIFSFEVFEVDGNQRRQLRLGKL